MEYLPCLLILSKVTVLFPSIQSLVSLISVPKDFHCYLSMSSPLNMPGHSLFFLNNLVLSQCKTCSDSREYQYPHEWLSWSLCPLVPSFCISKDFSFGLSHSLKQSQLRDYLTLSSQLQVPFSFPVSDLCRFQNLQKLLLHGCYQRSFSPSLSLSVCLHFSCIHFLPYSSHLPCFNTVIISDISSQPFLYSFTSSLPNIYSALPHICAHNEVKMPKKLATFISMTTHYKWFLGQGNKASHIDGYIIYVVQIR